MELAIFTRLLQIKQEKQNETFQGKESNLWPVEVLAFFDDSVKNVALLNWHQDWSRLFGGTSAFEPCS